MSSVGRVPGIGLVLTLLACGPAGTVGDRAELGGGCPPGETCSAESGRGLHFEGPGRGGLFDSSVVPIALGGTATVRLVDPRGYAVTNYRADLEPNLLDVVATEVDQVTLRAVAEGSCQLRILDAQGQLRDRTTLEVIRAHTVRASYGWWFGPPTPEEAAWYGIHPLESVAIFAGARADVNIDVGGGLWDDAASLTVAGRTLQTDDTFPVEPGAVDVVVRGGDLEDTYVVPIIDAPDPVQFGPELSQIDPAGRASIACFRGFAGGRPVAGLSCGFTGDSGVDLGDVVLWFTDACVTVTLVPDGVRGVTVTCGRTTIHWAHPVAPP